MATATPRRLAYELSGPLAAVNWLTCASYATTALHGVCMCSCLGNCLYRPKPTAPFRRSGGRITQRVVILTAKAITDQSRLQYSEQRVSMMACQHVCKPDIRCAYRRASAQKACAICTNVELYKAAIAAVRRGI